MHQLETAVTMRGLKYPLDQCQFAFQKLLAVTGFTHVQQSFSISGC